MESYEITIEKMDYITHDVIHLVCTKPENYNFKPGQATHLSIHTDELKNEKGAFTFTNLPEANQLEFVIKIYPSHKGFTYLLKDLKKGDLLTMGEPYGYIEFKGSGMFIAGGAGITPFLSIFKDLERKQMLKGNRLVFANDKKEDIIYENQLKQWFGNDLISILSDENTEDDYFGKIDLGFLKNAIEDFTQKFYLCGPPAMVKSLSSNLSQLGVKNEQIIHENFS